MALMVPFAKSKTRNLCSEKAFKREPVVVVFAVQVVIDITDTPMQQLSLNRFVPSV